MPSGVPSREHIRALRRNPDSPGPHLRPDGTVEVYLDMNQRPAPPKDAAMVKVIRPDGSVTFRPPE